MPQCIAPRGPSRRALLLAGAAALLPLAARASAVCTPQDLSRRYESQVDQRLQVPFNEACIYGALAESEISPTLRELDEPQYLLVVDSCPDVQVAFLFWRLMPTQFELIGASPASTGCAARPGHLPTPVGAYPQAKAEDLPRPRLATRVYDFGVHRTRVPAGGFAQLRLQARAATGAARSRLGTAQSDGCVLLPPALVAFLDRYGVLDGTHQRVTPAGELMPFGGRYLVVVDSEREGRPEWAAA